jgi:hypothetical protein
LTNVADATKDNNMRFQLVAKKAQYVLLLEELFEAQELT